MRSCLPHHAVLLPSSHTKETAPSQEGTESGAACGLIPQGWTGYWDSLGRQELLGWLSGVPLSARSEEGGREGSLGSTKLLEEQDWSRGLRGGSPTGEAVEKRPKTFPVWSSLLLSSPPGPEVILSCLFQGLKQMSLFPFPHCDIVI